MIKNLTVLLTALFIGLKLGNVIDWSWWLVLTPVFIYIGLELLICALVLIAYKKDLLE